MRNFFIYYILFFLPTLLVAQVKSISGQQERDKSINGFPKSTSKISNKNTYSDVSLNLYKIISYQRDTTHVDTSLTIQKEYKSNYLRKDIFGLLPFANEGQTYNVLDYSQKKQAVLPDFGFRAKQFNYLDFDEINYYHVPTPVTELYYKTVMEQGHNLDAFLTVNTNQRTNFSIAYKGLRSLGKYINQLSSTGNFRFTASYNTTNERYFLRTHFTAQDILNGENGGIANSANFSEGEEEYKNRARIPVFYENAKSFLKGNRYFVDHQFRINKDKKINQLWVAHQFNYEHKFFEYNQQTITANVLGENGQNTTINRYGDAFVSSGLRDQTRYNRMYNKIGAEYEHASFGNFSVFIEDFRFNHYYRRVVIFPESTIPSTLSDNINLLGAAYQYKIDKFAADIRINKSISDTDLMEARANVRYQLDDKNIFKAQLSSTSRVPNHTYNLFQSNFINYNWHNNFENQKTTSLNLKAETKWLNAEATLSTINDYVYFYNTNSNPFVLTVKPNQYDKTINYFSAKASKEFKFWKLALDNTLMLQQVSQDNDVLNVPQFITRNTLYFSGHFFKKALFLQTGITLNYFTSYYADGYNPVIGEMYVQNQEKIGNFPKLDFFVNAKIRTARIYLKAEHFNSAMTGYNYFSAPNYPYRDFIIRFGLEWNFFQ